MMPLDRQCFDFCSASVHARESCLNFPELDIDVKFIRNYGCLWDKLVKMNTGLLDRFCYVTTFFFDFTTTLRYRPPILWKILCGHISFIQKNHVLNITTLFTCSKATTQFISLDALGVIFL